MKRILYISYDGMTDPLGQSQVIPYLIGLSKLGYKFTLLSFEKKNKYHQLQQLIRSQLQESGIEWQPMTFTSRPPLLAKFYDVMRMRRRAFRLQHKEHFSMIHCRGYLTADIGLALKKKFGVKFFFDMRGFWADEKKDGGAWNENHPVFRFVYRYYKKKEKSFIREADCIISLTEAGRSEILKWSSYTDSVPIRVIPCCADIELFSVVKQNEKAESRKKLGIDSEKLVISYLGSLGSWYMLSEMLDFFVVVKNEYPGALFLFVTHSSPVLVMKLLKAKGLNENDIKITEARREEVPVFIKASDFSLSFIKPVYSKISSSPTKLGEILSMGIPVVANSGVGDIKETIINSGGGIIINNFSSTEYKEVVSKIPELLNTDPAGIRKNVSEMYDLRKGVLRYDEAYKLCIG